MSNQKSHDLYDFMRQISAEMSAEYDRIQMRATEDPGTAGDQGEENWADLLREWLPRSFEVVTKGRIISQEGETSPQIDVLVLNGEYPTKLLNKKLYLAAGVAAVFECKTTLKASHIAEAVENCVKTKSLYPSRIGSPYKELHTPLVYGLLAHSHSWKGANSTPVENTKQKLHECDTKYLPHPRFQLDLLCVADLAAWAASKRTFVRPGEGLNFVDQGLYGPLGAVTTSYNGHTPNYPGQLAQFTPIGVLISQLCQKLAWEKPALRDLADYYRVTKIAGYGKGLLRVWPSSVYSEEIRYHVEGKQLSSGKPWDEWSEAF